MKQPQNRDERMIKERTDQLIADCIKIEEEMERESPNLEKLHQRCIGLKQKAKQLHQHVTKHTPSNQHITP